MKVAEFVRKVDELGHRYSAIFINNSVIVYQKKFIKGKLLNKILLIIIHLDNKSVNLELSDRLLLQHPHVKGSKEYKLSGNNPNNSYIADHSFENLSYWYNPNNFYIADYSFENLPYWNNLNTLVDEFISGLD